MIVSKFGTFKTRAEYLRVWRANNLVSARRSGLKWYYANKLKARKISIAWKKNNPDKVKAQYRRAHDRNKRQLVHRTKNLKSYRERNPEKVKEATKAWRVKSRQHIRKYFANRYAKNPDFALACRVRSRISKMLRGAGTYKNNKTVELIGIPLLGLKKYIESQFLAGMSWENRSMWHLDHKRPCSSFDLKDPAQQKQCFHYTNLQPLWWRDNLTKSDKWNPK